MIDPQIDAVLAWLRREDGRINDIFGLWTQGKRDDGWLADRLVTEGHLEALTDGLAYPLEGAAQSLVDVIDSSADYEVTNPVHDAADVLRAALAAPRWRPPRASRNIEVTVHIADLDEVRDALEHAARLEAAVRAYLDVQREPAYSWVRESQEARIEGRPNREMERMERVNAARDRLRALLRGDQVPEAVRCDCWRCGRREPDGTLHGAGLHASYSPAPSYRLVQVTGSLEDHPGHVCFSDARYDGLRDWWDGLTDAERREAYLVEKGNADALAASIERQP